MSFSLHPQLRADTFEIMDLPLSKLLLMNDSRISWLILVPRKLELTEIYQLEHNDQLQLWHEISIITKFSHTFFSADKMNVAALGNSVPQLHIHVIARKKTDTLWPQAVWGQGDRISYDEIKVTSLVRQLKDKIILNLNGLMSVIN